MTKNYIHTHIEDVAITPEAPTGGAASQTGPLKKLLGRVMDRLSAITGNPWYQGPDHDLKKMFRLAQETRNNLLIGGGSITFSSGRLLWTNRFVLMPATTEQSSNYYIQVPVTPVSGVTDHNAAERANAQGIQLNEWDGLWIIHTRSQNATTGNTLRVAPYASVLSNSLIENPDAYLLCTRMGDSYNYVQFSNGVKVGADGTAYSGGLSYSQVNGTQEIRAADERPLRVVNTQNTGAGADTGASNLVSFRDSEGDEQWWIGVNDDGDLELGTDMGTGKGVRFWDTSIDVLRNFYHEGNHGKLYSVKHVRTAATTNITRSGTQTIGGVALGVNDRIGLFGQTTASENGIYSVQSGAWTRVSDMNESSEVYSGLLVMVNEGSLAGTLYRLATADPITIDSTGLTFSSIAGGGAVTGHNFWSATHPDVDAADAPGAGEVPTYDASSSKWLSKPIPHPHTFFYSGGIVAKTGEGHDPVEVAKTADVLFASLDVAPAGGTVTVTFVREAGGPGGATTTIGSTTFAIGERGTKTVTGLTTALSQGDTVRVDVTTGAGYTAASAKSLTAKLRCR